MFKKIGFIDISLKRVDGVNMSKSRPASKIISAQTGCGRVRQTVANIATDSQAALLNNLFKNKWLLYES
jgi:hypothetical protein